MTPPALSRSMLEAMMRAAIAEGCDLFAVAIAQAIQAMDENVWLRAELARYAPRAGVGGVAVIGKGEVN